MSGHRRRAGLLPLVTTFAAAAFHACWLRPRMLTWGATEEEIRQVCPGDGLVPDADSSSTMATTLPAPPGEVWAWLLQMGGDRGGWYSWDWLDHYGEPSADRIVPAWQHLETGQRLTAARDRRIWFTVAVLEPDRTLVLHSELELPSGHSVVHAPDTGPVPEPRGYAEGIWGFHLRPEPGARTRLVVRTRGRSRPRALTRPFDLLLGEPAHFVMQTRQFHNLRARVAARA